MQFQPVLTDFENKTGITAQYEENCEVDRIRLCTDNSDCPDAAIIAQPGLMTDLGCDGKIVDLSTIINLTLLNTNYSKTWVDLGKADDTLYGVWFNAGSKILVWYDPEEFVANSWTTPGIWTETITLNEQIVNNTNASPWSIGSKNGAASLAGL